MSERRTVLVSAAELAVKTVTPTPIANDEELMARRDEARRKAMRVKHLHDCYATADYADLFNWGWEAALATLSAENAQLKAQVAERDEALLNDIAVTMSEFVDNWPQPKKVSTALKLVAKTIRAALAEKQEAQGTPIILQMAAASREAEMWERRFQALIRMYPDEERDKHFVDRDGSWGINGFLRYAGEVCAFSPDPAALQPKAEARQSKGTEE